MKRKLTKLPQELINQIAAGEVVERPASIVKELLDNAIDAGANEIKINVENGGINLIEVSDNGLGIEESELEKVFDAHTTSKIGSLEDLNRIMTMGFRGEALSTIRSVAKVSVSSKYESAQVAYSLNFEKGNAKKKVARNQGTTVTVRDLFYNIPARRKFLKTAETEYRKILETAVSYFLQFPNIHFILEKEGKQVYNLPKASEQPGVETERIKAVIKSGFVTNLIPIHSDGAGIKISGFVAHPSFHQSKTSHQHIFINRRPIWDNGIAKSVLLGFSTHIPRGEKVPFIIDIEINPELIDVNVHPRKEEVKFINPYRAYSAVEDAVSASLKKSLRLTEPTQTTSSNFSYKHQSAPAALFDSVPTSKTKEINFSKKRSDFSINKSLEFSREILSKQEENISEVKNVFQVFNKYIVVEFEKEMWMIDQHAAAERITFEKLSKNYDSKPQDIQNLLVPTEIEASPAEISFISENIQFFKKLGFEIETEEEKIKVKSTPAYFQQANIETIFKEIWEHSDEQRDMKESFDKAKESILATMSCHSSIRTGQRLSTQEAMQLYNDLKECENPYSCPHGRPVIWKMELREIDSNFDRTY